MSFFITPLAQNSLSRITFKETDTLLLANQDGVHMPSHQGKPSMVHSSGRFKMVYIYGAMDSKAYGATNHFEMTRKGVAEGIRK